jgi:uncharacterized hydrophobic protein (TIGR00271 family)
MQTARMLHLTLRVPFDVTDNVMAVLVDSPSVTNVALVRGGFTHPPGDLVGADVAREGANSVIGALRNLGVPHAGALTISEPGTILSDAAVAAEKAAPGVPDDGVVWDVVENRVRMESRLSWSFCSFLTLATVIAGIGRLLDQPILIIGAMVVGPEFSPVAAICVALARPRPSLLPRAVTTLFAGFGLAVAVAVPAWWVARLVGLANGQDASSGPQTDFIVQPDIWSFIIAMLAGAAGVLALTTSKSGTLVGVFISVTTVPAVGTVALCIGLGVWSEIPGALFQLSLNLLGLVVAGSLTLLVQRAVWRRVSEGRRIPTP